MSRASALEAYTRLARRLLQAVARTAPRSIVTLAAKSVNQAPRKRVGSTLAAQVAPPVVHQARARVCSAVTQGAIESVEFHPADGPAPSARPQSGRTHSTSATPCSAAVRPSSLRVVPVQMPSPPNRHASSSGAVAPQKSARPWANQAPPGSAARAPTKSDSRLGETSCRVGVTEATDKREPPANRTVPTPKPTVAWV